MEEELEGCGEGESSTDKSMAECSRFEDEDDNVEEVLFDEEDEKNEFVEEGNILVISPFFRFLLIPFVFPLLTIVV